MEKRKTFGGLAGILAGAGLGLMAAMSGGGCSMGPPWIIVERKIDETCDKAIYSTSYLEISQERPKNPNYWITRDINHDGIADCVIIGLDGYTNTGLGKIFDQRIIPGDKQKQNGPIGINHACISFRYKNNNKNFEVEDLEKYMHGRNAEEQALADRLYPLFNEGIKGHDVLDKNGKLKQRVFYWPKDSGMNLERIEDFDEQG